MDNGITKIVDDTYKHFRENNKKADFKFTFPMLAIITGNITENDIDDLKCNPSPDKKQLAKMEHELINRVINSPNTSEITHFYIKKCKEKLGEFDPTKIKENLIKIGLL